MELQFNEVIELVIGVVVAPLLIFVTRRSREDLGWNYLLAGYGLFIAADIFTVAEGVGGTLGEWLNLAEHASFFGSGMCMAMASWSILNNVREAARRAG